MILIGLAALQAAVALAAPAEAASPSTSLPVADVVPEAPGGRAALGTSVIVVPQDTPVELMAVAEVTTADATPGTRFRLRVNRPVVIGGQVVVPVGTPAFGEVITARDSGGLGKSGRMTARLLHIQLGDVQLPLEGEMSAKGTGAGSAGVAFLLTGVVGLFHRGNNAKIKAGELLAGFVRHDVLLNLGGASPQRADVAGPAGAAVP